MMVVMDVMDDDIPYDAIQRMNAMLYWLQYTR
jgi:hypothetical protein